MNDHEIDRIAAAMHQARPDWPVKQLRTLLTDPRMIDRPRRDVFVELAWVACEAGTSSPYRVLESGPWKRASAIDGATTRREILTPAERCSTCSQPRHRCEAVRHADDDHTFTPDFKHTQPAIDTTATIQALKDLKQPTTTTEENA